MNNFDDYAFDVVQELNDMNLRYFFDPYKEEITVISYGPLNGEDLDILYEIADDFGLRLDLSDFGLSESLQTVHHTDRGYNYTFRE